MYFVLYIYIYFKLWENGKIEIKKKIHDLHQSSLTYIVN